MSNELTPRIPEQKEQKPAKEITIFEVKNGYIVKQGQACATSEFLVFPTMDRLVTWLEEWGE